MIAGYISVKEVPIFQSTESLALRILEEVGLLDDLSTLITLEKVYYEYKSAKAQEKDNLDRGKARALTRARGG